MKVNVLIAILGLLATSAPASIHGPKAEMKIMTYNVMHCEGLDGKIDVARTASVIMSENPDFACLQEIDWRTFRSSGIDEPTELARLTGMHATFARAIFFDGGQYGVMVLSRKKPIDVLQLPLPGEEPRVLLVCEFKDCVIATSHLSVSDRKERETSVPIIRKAFSRYGKPVFFTGDWNATPDSDVLRSLGEFLVVVSDRSCRTFHGRAMDGPQVELGDNTPFCIDYVAVDSGHASDFEVVDTHVVEDRITSDHAPVVVTVAFARPDLPEPAIVPAPISIKTSAGQWRARATEVSSELFALTMDESLPKEGYRILITEKDGIAVTCASEVGAFYAVRTLEQLATPSWGRLGFPCCEIVDMPRFSWRGVHVDDSRHFFGKAAIKRVIDLMALHKLNVLHWHLTDSQGWRLPVSRYPKLTTIGASRPYSKNQKDIADLFEDGIYGPFAYSREDVAEVVAYAKAHCIRIIPEVDVPGHSGALLRAYPEMGCFDEDPSIAPQDAVGDVVCVGDDRVIEMLKCVFDEVVEMFPDELVHIGGDEVKKVNWRVCRKCQDRMRAHGLTSVNELQAWFMREIAMHLAKRGRRAIGWDEIILDGEAPSGAVVMSWRGAEGGRVAAAAGHDAVMCPHTNCYLDYAQCLAEDPATYPWFSHQLSLAKVYAYDPLDGIPKNLSERILGGQCCNWSEYTCNETELQWKMWPRTCAAAEVFWSSPENRNYNDFRRRMERHRRRLIEMGVNCAPLE